MFLWLAHTLATRSNKDTCEVGVGSWAAGRARGCSCPGEFLPLVSLVERKTSLFPHSLLHIIAPHPSPFTYLSPLTLALPHLPLFSLILIFLLHSPISYYVYLTLNASFLAYANPLQHAQPAPVELEYVPATHAVHTNDSVAPAIRYPQSTHSKPSRRAAHAPHPGSPHFSLVFLHFPIINHFKYSSRASPLIYWIYLTRRNLHPEMLVSILHFLVRNSLRYRLSLLHLTPY